MSDLAARVATLVAAFETLRPESLPALGELYAADARFVDPFNEVRGRQAVVGIFAHMFAQVEIPRFVVRERIVDAAAGKAVLVWDFHFRAAGRERRIHGSSWLVFAADGRVAEHRDYWDAAGELYAQLPLLGPLMRWLRRRLAAPPPA